jgi:parallel beta-helix repeat protein
MKIKHLIFLFLLLFSLVAFSETSFNANILQPVKLIQHDPIVINSDSDFETYDFEGSGTQEEPYIIEGYEIEATGSVDRGIEITSTTVYFIIQNCYITSDDTGIFIRDVAEDTSKIILNECTGTSGWGVGIGIQYMNGCQVENNTCSNFSAGIHVNAVTDFLIRFNTATDNARNGINIRYSDNNSVTHNILEDNTQHGFAIIGESSFNEIHHNTFIDNSNAETYTIDGTRTGNINSQGFDEGSQNIWYDEINEHGNWWSDFPGEGDYEIDGPADSVDTFPKQFEKQSDETTLCLIPCLILVAFSISVLRKKKKKKEN